jgi:hypothetical protein
MDRDRSVSYTLCCGGPLTFGFLAVAVGQVMNRLQLTWNGLSAQSAPHSARAFLAFLHITLSFTTLHFSLIFAEQMLDPRERLSDRVGRTGTMVALDFIEETLSILYGILVLRLIRIRRRAKYGIWGSNVDDCCVTVFFPARGRSTPPSCSLTTRRRLQYVRSCVLLCNAPVNRRSLGSLKTSLRSLFLSPLTRLRYKHRTPVKSLSMTSGRTMDSKEYGFSPPFQINLE